MDNMMALIYLKIWGGGGARSFETRNLGDRSFCFRDLSPAPKICGMDSQSMQHNYRCPVSSMGSRKVLHFPPFCYICRVLSKVLRDHTHAVILIKPCWQTQLWYPKVLSMLVAPSLLIKKCPTAISCLVSETPPICTE